MGKPKKSIPCLRPDLWCEVIPFLDCQKTFFNLLLCVKNLREYLERICPEATKNIEFKYIKTPLSDTPLSYVTNLKCCVKTRKTSVDYACPKSSIFPNLMTLSIRIRKFTELQERYQKSKKKHNVNPIIIPTYKKLKYLRIRIPQPYFISHSLPLKLPPDSSLESLYLFGPLTLKDSMFPRSLRNLEIHDCPKLFENNEILKCQNLVSLKICGRNNIHKFPSPSASLRTLKFLEFKTCGFKFQKKRKKKKDDIRKNVNIFDEYKKNGEKGRILPFSANSFINPEVHIYEISNLPSLRSLKIFRKKWISRDNHRMDSIFKLRKIRNLRSLNTLDFETYKLDEYVNILDHLPSKLLVKIQNSSVGFDVDGVGGFPKIENLDLLNSNFPLSKYVESVSGKYLRTLKYSCCSSKIANRHLCVELVDCKVLRSLELGKEQTYLSIKNCKKLEFLSLEVFKSSLMVDKDNNIMELEGIIDRGGIKLDFLKFGENYKNLRKLNLGYGRIFRAENETLEKLEKLEELTVFQHDLSSFLYMDRRVDTFKLKNLPNLRILKIRMCTTLSFENTPNIQFFEVGYWILEHKRFGERNNNHVMKKEKYGPYGECTKNFDISIGEGIMNFMNLVELKLRFVEFSDSIKSLIKFLCRKKKCGNMERIEYSFFDNRAPSEVEKSKKCKEVVDIEKITKKAKWIRKKARIIRRRFPRSPRLDDDDDDFLLI